jgi:demethylmenaquinone methyltransferase/2-methoxy-6-polyprenyl-1,4-benzoquinol methylase
VKNGHDIHYAQRLAEDTRFPDGYFDMVGDCIMFHEVSAEGARKVLKEAHRVLRPGGVFTHIDVMTNGYKGYKPARTIAEKASLFLVHRDNIETWWVQYLNSDFPELLRTSGFSVEVGGPGVGNTQKSVGTYPRVTGVKLA